MTSSRARALALCAGLGLSTLSPSPASAQSRAATAQDLETARTLYRQGKELRLKGDLRGAAEKLRAAHALGNTPVTGIELARTYALLGRLVEAREVALSIARMPVAGDETEKSADARAEAAKLAEEVRPRIATIAVKVVGAGPGRAVHLEIDGASVPDAALLEPRQVDPGRHEVVLRSGEGASALEARASAEVAEGKTTEVTLELPAAPPAAPSTNGAANPEPGVRPSHGWPALARVGIGTAVAGAAIGLYGGVTALTKKSQLASECNAQKQCDPSNGGSGDLQQAQTWATVSTVSFAIAGVGLAAGLYSLLTDRAAAERPAAARVTPWVGPGMAGIHGDF